MKAVKKVVFDLTTLSLKAKIICDVYETEKFNIFRDKNQEIFCFSRNNMNIKFQFSV